MNSAQAPAISIALVAAVAQNRVIGGDNRLLWRLKSDLQHFRHLTMGRPMIMGRKTFDSIGKPLPGRETIVVTRDAGWHHAGVHVAADLPAALDRGRALAAKMTSDAVMVVGGGEIYRQTIDLADRLHITEVALTPEGDALFPAIDRLHWREVSRANHAKGPDDEADFAFVDYLRQR